jgi:CubicO group peptidase (beta-lactamase class C family)
MKRTKNSWVLIVLISLLNYPIYAQKSNDWLQYKDVKQAGFSQEMLDSVSTTFDQMRSASLMVIYKGKVLMSLGDPSRRFMCHSIRKSFMSAMYGIYLEKGDLSLDKSLRELGIQDRESLTETELGATVKHLISARSGIYHPAAYEPRSMKSNRPQRGSAAPGASFFYNNWDFNTLVTIFNQETNQDFFEAFVKDIANQIGMQDLRMEDMNYRNEPDKSVHPAYLFKMSTRDLARFGQLYLNKGQWNGDQIVPQDWIETSTRTHSDTENFAGRDGYGYLWWIDNHSFSEPAYYASGLGGHLMYVFPKSEMIIVHRVNSYLMMSERSEKITQLINLIFDAKTGKESKKPKLIPFSTAEESDEIVTISNKQLMEYTGTYSHSFFGEMKVYLDGNQLKVTGEILGNFRLIPKSVTQFEVEDIPELPLVMVKADDKNKQGTSITEVNERRMPVKIVMYF